MFTHMDLLNSLLLVLRNNKKTSEIFGGFFIDYFFLYEEKVRNKMMRSMNPPRANPKRQDISQERKKKLAWHCFSLGSKAIQSGITLIRSIRICMRWWYFSLAIFPETSTAIPERKNIDSASIPINAGTLSHCGWWYMSHPVTRASHISPKPSIDFSFSFNFSREI